MYIVIVVYIDFFIAPPRFTALPVQHKLFEDQYRQWHGGILDMTFFGEPHMKTVKAELPWLMYFRP
jgi:hypothetical protein